MKLTARTTASAALPEGKTDHIYWDTDLTGFGLRVRLGSDRVRKTFIALYRAHGRTRRVLIGSAEKLGAEQARAAAKKVLGRAAIGEDPQAERRAQRQRASCRPESKRAPDVDWLLSLDGLALSGCCPNHSW